MYKEIDKKSFLYASAGILVLFLLIGVVSNSLGRLNERTRLKLETTKQLWSSSEIRFQGLNKNVRSMIKSKPKLFAVKEQDWLSKLNSMGKQKEMGAMELSEATQLADQNDDAIRVQIESRINSANQRRLAIIQGVTEIDDLAKRIIKIDSAKDQVIKEIKGIYQKLVGYTPTEIARTQSAIIDWPAKKTYLTSRIESMNEVKKNAEILWNENKEKFLQPSVDSFVLLDLLQNLQTYDIQQARLNGELRQHVDELYLSWDKILTDMEVKENETITLHHKYRKVRVRVESPRSKKGTHSESEEWVQVSKKTYDTLKDKLGMSVARKAAGKFENEAENLAQPPGYSYIAAPGQGNQYGQWRRDSYGGSFWAFYGQYMFMSHLFWGPTYGPIYRNDYNSYRRSYTTGRTYYGRTNTGRPRYGTNSRGTVSKYRSSRYVRNGGYRNSYYSQSGGNLRGYRASRRQRTSGGRGGSYRFGGSRSFGGK